jgi:hypothetical protein
MRSARCTGGIPGAKLPTRLPRQRRAGKWCPRLRATAPPHDESQRTRPPSPQGSHHEAANTVAGGGTSTRQTAGQTVTKLRITDNMQQRTPADTSRTSSAKATGARHGGKPPAQGDPPSRRRGDSEETATTAFAPISTATPWVAAEQRCRQHDAVYGLASHAANSVEQPFVCPNQS